MTAIDITGLDKGAVLAALYNAARPQGLGFLSYEPSPMTLAEATEHVSTTMRFDYIKGRVLKVDLAGNWLNPHNYDRDSGDGAAAVVIAELRATGTPDGNLTTGIHEHGRERAAIIAQEHMVGSRTTADGPRTINVGVDGASDALAETIAPFLPTNLG